MEDKAPDYTEKLQRNGLGRERETRRRLKVERVFGGEFLTIVAIMQRLRRCVLFL